jgi:hypothetical protein
VDSETDLLDWDIALVHLDAPIGRKAGWMGLASDCEQDKSASAGTSQDRSAAAAAPAAAEASDPDSASRASAGRTFVKLKTAGYTSFGDASMQCVACDCSVTFNGGGMEGVGTSVPLPGSTDRAVVNSCAKSLLFPACDATKGQSGSAMFTMLPAPASPPGRASSGGADDSSGMRAGRSLKAAARPGPYVRAVLTGQLQVFGVGAVNAGVRITPEFAYAIMQWISQSSPVKS